MSQFQLQPPETAVQQRDVGAESEEWEQARRKTVEDRGVPIVGAPL